MREPEPRTKDISWEDAATEMLKRMKDGVWYKISELFTPYVSYKDFNKKSAFLKWCIKNGLIERRLDNKSVLYKKISASNK